MKRKTCKLFKNVWHFHRNNMRERKSLLLLLMSLTSLPVYSFFRVPCKWWKVKSEKGRKKCKYYIVILQPTPPPPRSALLLCKSIMNVNTQRRSTPNKQQQPAIHSCFFMKA